MPATTPPPNGVSCEPVASAVATFFLSLIRLSNERHSAVKEVGISEALEAKLEDRGNSPVFVLKNCSESFRRAGPKALT